MSKRLDILKEEILQDIRDTMTEITDIFEETKLKMGFFPRQQKVVSIKPSEGSFFVNSKINTKN